MEEEELNRGELSRFSDPTIFIQGSGAGIDFSDIDQTSNSAEFMAKIAAKIDIPFTYRGHKV